MNEQPWDAMKFVKKAKKKRKRKDQIMATLRMREIVGRVKDGDEDTVTTIRHEQA